MPTSFDTIVVGAGHNGLVLAAYLAKAGEKVLVLEGRDRVGGACTSEERWPGFQVSTAAYVVSLFRPEIVRDLDLARHGYAVLKRDPSSFTPFPDGRSLLMGPDRAMTLAEVAKLSPRDAERLPRYEAMLERAAAAIEPTLLETPPDPFSRRLGDLLRLGKMGWRFLALGKDGPAALEVLTASARQVLDRWFESDALKATLATDAIIGAWASPSTPGTAYVLFHHVMGETDGVRGVWGYVKGGMGRLSEAIASAARAAGAEIRLEAPVERILVEGGAAVGVVLADGAELRARRVASNADASRTLLGLVGEKHLPAEVVEGAKAIDYSSGTVKINVALDALPDFRARPGRTPQPWHRGTIHVSPTMEYLERAFDDARAGRCSSDPILECTIPSVVDPTVAPAGKHVMSMFVQYAPYRLAPQGVGPGRAPLGGAGAQPPEAQGSWDVERDRFADRCFDVLEEYAPGFKASVLHREVFAPPDLEARFGLTGGNIFQGAMTLSQLAFMRPLPGLARYRTPIRNLYMCGAATHPGGGVMGACGYNAAREMLRDRRRGWPER